ncbi:MAG: TIGR00282 family metallophosphoesterase [Chitinivibrionales bacterium]|nr:TIGR00282 family metallophosphoesterase [Chitinivibrionales bacterium]MBD3355943.1 TIGR00282 family metallophosphoesterase [Chitinivibrionales bacterium]
MRILFVGDVFGNIGRRVLADHLSHIKIEHRIDLCIANGENAAGGKGITANLAKKFRRYGVSVITGGNHSFASTEAVEGLESGDYVLRPLNYPPGNVGVGKTIVRLDDGSKVGIINLQGRTFLSEALDCPFRIGSSAIDDLLRETPIVIIDFHAEATSEKAAFAYYVDGRASAVLGTHTHVQTADERILPGGTAFISDVGMTGPENSIIGMKPSAVIRRFLLQTFARFEPSNEGPLLCAVVVEIDNRSGKALGIERIQEQLTFS